MCEELFTHEITWGHLHSKFIHGFILHLTEIFPAVAFFNSNFVQYIDHRSTSSLQHSVKGLVIAFMCV